MGVGVGVTVGVGEGPDVGVGVGAPGEVERAIVEEGGPAPIAFWAKTCTSYEVPEDSP